VRVGRDLWDSWEDDAAIRDVDTGRYLDRAKLHHIDFVGETYTVKGPAIVPRPPQGQLVVFAPDGLVPPELVDVALVDEPARIAGVPLTFVEVEVALHTGESGAAERVAALGGWPATPRRRHVGSAEGLVALLTELAGAVDGVRLHPLVLDEDLPELSARVLPALFERGLATRPVPGASLRTTLGLPRPANRYARSEPA
jgi:alkanesulfonate monooxygenase SsuD/methylene tetrahydromethanopterin reductase-like flavin-dependent oxidoreductase (luciferase family)